jgi:FlaA1/EpsC-like NDP-sugar epimerase
MPKRKASRVGHSALMSEIPSRTTSRLVAVQSRKPTRIATIFLSYRNTLVVYNELVFIHIFNYTSSVRYSASHALVSLLRAQVMGHYFKVTLVTSPAAEGIKESNPFKCALHLFLMNTKTSWVFDTRERIKK